MQTILYVNPLKKGKLKEYKEFSAQNTGPRKKEYIDLLKRYGLRNAKVYYHKLGGIDFVMVIHDAEDDALQRLEKFSESTNPYDQWFWQQLVHLHDFSHLEGDPRAPLLFSFDVNKH